MTRALHFTEAAIQRAIRAARAAGLEVAGCEIRPDGTIVVLTSPPLTASPALTGEPPLRDARELLK